METGQTYSVSPSSVTVIFWLTLLIEMIRRFLAGDLGLCLGFGCGFLGLGRGFLSALVDTAASAEARGCKAGKSQKNITPGGHGQEIPQEVVTSRRDIGAFAGKRKAR